jgi:stage IV sporulation protein FB
LLTGLFKDFIILFSIIIIHEIGHLLAASYYKFNIYKIYLYPFGGYIKFNDKLNRALKEEFIVLICGPMFQIFYYFLMMGCYDIGFISDNTFNMFINYHYSLLLFNLLPIFPLDGSKLVNIILSKFISFKQSHLVMLYISYTVLFISLLAMQYISLNVNLYLLLILLFTKLLSETKNHKTIYNRFLLERYLYKFHFTKLKIIKGNKLSRMMRDKKHLFVFDNKEITERQLLKKRYDKH